jgi:arylsulfatase A-like enzyme/predicted esterase
MPSPKLTPQSPVDSWPRRAFLVGGLAPFVIPARPSASRPNIVLVMADDQGWGDTGYHGHRILKTPCLDEMARQGVRFNRFYSGAPVCSPTRGSCLTGRHPFRYGIFFANAGRPGQPSEYALPDREVTLAEVLGPLGYRTGHFGKWHLGDFEGPKKASPSDAGFQEWFSTVRKVPTVDPPPSEYWENGRPVTERLSGDDSRIIMDRALPFIQRSAAGQQPFLAVIWFHTPHVPVLATAEDRARYAGHAEMQQHYWGALSAMDKQVGRLRAELRRLGVAGNTMLWYASDNGPEGDQESVDWPGTAGPLRGRKTSLFEGGVRVPGILEWPKRFPKPRALDAVSSTSDYFPTILDALGIQPIDRRPLDGVSLLPLLEDRVKERPAPLAFETSRITRGSPRLALIENRYKLLTNLDASGDLLFDIVSDPQEKVNLASQLPAETQRMRRTLAEWRESCRRSLAGAEPVFVPDVTYQSVNGRELKLDLALPAEGKTAAPVVVCLHGGGWSMGDKKSFHKIIRDFAAEGFAAATVQYRLAPGSKYPAQVEDVRAAIRFLRANVSRWRLDPSRVAIMGASAGAHLALLAGYTPHRKKEAVQAVIDVSGPTDLRSWRMQPKAEENLRTTVGKTNDTLLSDFLGTSDRAAPILWEASPLAHVRPGLPPTLIFQYEDDQAVPTDQAAALDRALSKAGVEHELVWIAGRGHALVPSGVERIVRETLRFLKRLTTPAAGATPEAGRSRA